MTIAQAYVVFTAVDDAVTLRVNTSIVSFSIFLVAKVSKVMKLSSLKGFPVAPSFPVSSIAS